jgi:TonB family protein
MLKYSKAIIAAAACAAALIALAPSVRADVTYYMPPKFKHKVLPVYPETARAAHETGSVLIKVLVQANGLPKQFILFKSSGHKDLDAAVLAAAKASTYVPAMRGATPTIGFYDVTYKFNLTGVAQDEGNQADLAKKLDANPKDVPTRLALGTDYLNHKSYAQAEQVFDAGTRLVPNNAKLWAYKGLAYFQDAQTTNDAGKYKPAVDAYDQALKLDPKVDTNNIAAAAYFNYGFHKQTEGDNATALLYAQKAVALSPRTSQYYILLGEAQTAQGDYANAIATLKKSEALDDKKNSVVTSRILADEGNAELAQGDKVNGMADLNRAKLADGHAPFAYEYLFSYYIKSRNNAAALTPLMQLAQLQPTEPVWQIHMGNIYLSQNNVASAREAFKKALALKPDSPDAQLGMANLAAVTGDTATIASIMQKITAGATPQQAAIYQATIAIELLNAENGKTAYAADAQKYADQATKADPNNGQAWYALGVAQAELHNKDDANRALKKAYDIFKSQNNADMLKTVADVYKQINGSDIGGSNGKGENSGESGN